jgi:hypothetical protein
MSDLPPPVAPGTATGDDADADADAVDHPGSRYFWGVPKVTWLFLGYFLIVFVVGLVALENLTDDASSASVLALAGIVFGAVSTHLAHTAGHQMARER